MESITGMILAGGFGTRLQTVVADRPKVLAEVLGRPFITHLLDQLIRMKVQKTILCTGYRADQVQAALGDDYQGMKLLYSHEKEPLGTGGAIRLAVEQCDTDHVLAMNGDSYCAADFVQLLLAHQTKHAGATLTLVRVSDSSRFGKVICDASGAVKEFAEKAPGSGPGLINAGVYLLERKLVSEIALNKNISIEREVFPSWVGRGLYGFDAGDAPFIDIGTPESYAAAEAYLSKYSL